MYSDTILDLSAGCYQMLTQTRSVYANRNDDNAEWTGAAVSSVSEGWGKWRKSRWCRTNLSTIFYIPSIQKCQSKRLKHIQMEKWKMERLCSGCNLRLMKPDQFISVSSALWQNRGPLWDKSAPMQMLITATCFQSTQMLTNDLIPSRKKCKEKAKEIFLNDKYIIQIWFQYL